MIIEPKKMVTLTYHLTIKDQLGMNEISIQETNEKDPLIFLFGAGQLIPGFEKAIEGKMSGDLFDFWIPAHEAYGEVNPENFIDFPIEQFLNENGQFDAENIKVGKPITLMDAYGNQYMAKVHRIGLDKITLDFNHELAGKDLHFRGKIIYVRPATQEELNEAGFESF
jgi:FKBP-type peptidyl-prolyl cis-trans isomerase SlyD